MNLEQRLLTAALVQKTIFCMDSTCLQANHFNFDGNTAYCLTRVFSKWTAKMQ